MPRLLLACAEMAIADLTQFLIWFAVLPAYCRGHPARQAGGHSMAQTQPRAGA